MKMPRATGFRADIQGMRAIAVLVVLVYHVWPGVLPGGYVGVDVFFVISGYLITGLLVREFERSGTIPLRAFYARRIRRLLPAATATLLAVAVAATVWMAAAEWRDLSQELVASALYVQNLLLVHRALDYLALDAGPSPLQHFWSLSLEEQFYLLWPLLMLAAGGAAMRYGWPLRRALMGALLLVTLASLAHGIHVSLVDPAPGFFMTTTRVWELGLGGLLAIATDGRAGRRWLRRLLGWSGLVAILVAAWLYSSRLPFPGHAALLPTLGAAAMLWARLDVDDWLGRALASRPMQYLGDISYSLYLWHWPVAVFYPSATGRPVETLQDGVLVVVASLLLAHLSKHQIEDRFRHGSPRERLRPYAMAGALTAAVAGGALAMTAVAELRAREALVDLMGIPDGHPGALALLRPVGATAPREFIPALDAAVRDRGPAFGLDGSPRCFVSVLSSEPMFCHYGGENARRRIVIVGDSHAGHWLPAFEVMAEATGWRITGLTKSNCPFTDRMIQFVSHGVDRPYVECLDWGRKVLDWLLEYKPDLVIISNSSRHVLPGKDAPEESQATIAEGMVAYANRLLGAGIRVAAMRHTPWQSERVPTCMARPGASVASCSTPEPLAAPEASAELAARLDGRIHLLDTRRFFCADGICPVVIGNVLVYRDSHHLTATYARTMAPILRDEIAALLAK
jgi:peptidoglycan/LPS O-acetylase OafA/YrhL